MGDRVFSDSRLAQPSCFAGPGGFCAVRCMAYSRALCAAREGLLLLHLAVAIPATGPLSAASYYARAPKGKRQW
jgi:hypothetical protein